MPPELLKIFSQLTYLKPYRGRLFTASISVTHTRSPHTPTHTHTHHTHTPPHAHPPSLSTLPHARRVYPSTYTQNARPPCMCTRTPQPFPTPIPLPHAPKHCASCGQAHYFSPMFSFFAIIYLSVFLSFSSLLSLCLSLSLPPLSMTTVL